MRSPDNTIRIQDTGNISRRQFLTRTLPEGIASIAALAGCTLTSQESQKTPPISTASASQPDHKLTVVPYNDRDAYIPPEKDVYHVSHTTDAEPLSTVMTKTLIDQLNSPHAFDINGQSFKDYLGNQGATIVIIDHSHPQYGKVITHPSLRTRRFPITKELPDPVAQKVATMDHADINTDKTNQDHSMQFLNPDTPVSWHHSVRIVLQDGSTQDWIARYSQYNLSFVFNAHTFIDPKGNTEQFIETNIPPTVQ